MLEENLIAWRKRKEREDREKGMRQGLRTGRQKGMREILLRQLARRFGPLPVVVRRKVGAIRSTERLTQLADQVLTATSLRELGLE